MKNCQFVNSFPQTARFRSAVALHTAGAREIELTNHDSAGGKNSLSSCQCKLTGKTLKSSNFSHWRLH